MSNYISELSGQVMSTNVNLYHLSFNAKLKGVWKPKAPDGIDSNPDEEPSFLSEPSEPRISVAPTIEQCFQAIYPNVKHYFEELKYPYLTMTLYKATITKSTKLVTPEELTQQLKVWDAFVTEEHWLLTPTRMTPYAKLKIHRHSDLGRIEVDPFNDPKIDTSGDRHFVEPAVVQYEITKYFRS